MPIDLWPPLSLDPRRLRARRRLPAPPTASMARRAAAAEPRRRPRAPAADDLLLPLTELARRREAVARRALSAPAGRRAAWSACCTKGACSACCSTSCVHGDAAGTAGWPPAKPTGPAPSTCCSNPATNPSSRSFGLMQAWNVRHAAQQRRSCARACWARSRPRGWPRSARCTTRWAAQQPLAIEPEPGRIALRTVGGVFSVLSGTPLGVGDPRAEYQALYREAALRWLGHCALQPPPAARRQAVGAAPAGERLVARACSAGSPPTAWLRPALRAAGAGGGGAERGLLRSSVARRRGALPLGAGASHAGRPRRPTWSCAGRPASAWTMPNALLRSLSPKWWAARTRTGRLAPALATMPAQRPRCWPPRRWSNRCGPPCRAAAIVTRLALPAHLLLALARAAAGGGGAAQRALLVGVSELVNQPQSLWLQAPRNDVMLMRQALLKQGFAPGRHHGAGRRRDGAALPEAQRIHEALAGAGGIAQWRFRAASSRPRHAAARRHQALPGARWPGRELPRARRARRGRRRQRACAGRPARCRFRRLGAGLPGAQRVRLVGVRHLLGDLDDARSATHGAGHRRRPARRRGALARLARPSRSRRARRGRAPRAPRVVPPPAPVARARYVAFFASESHQVTPELRLPRKSRDARPQGLLTWAVAEALERRPADLARALRRRAGALSAGDRRTGAALSDARPPSPVAEGNLDAPLFANSTAAVSTRPVWRAQRTGAAHAAGRAARRPGAAAGRARAGHAGRRHRAQRSRPACAGRTGSARMRGADPRCAT